MLLYVRRFVVGIRLWPGCLRFFQNIANAWRCLNLRLSRRAECLQTGISECGNNEFSIVF